MTAAARTSSLDEALGVAILRRHYLTINFLHSVGADIYTDNGKHLIGAMKRHDTDMVTHLFEVIGDPKLWGSLKYDSPTLDDQTVQRYLVDLFYDK